MPGPLRGPGGEGKNKIGRRLLFLGWIVFAVVPGRVLCARIGLNPLMGDGAAGRSTVLTGTGFAPNTTYTVYFGGVPALPALPVVTDNTGSIAAVSVALPALPAGFHDVYLSSPAWSVSFTGAYRVVRNICVSPVIGDGRAGMTWITNPAIPVGGWVGMVFILDGTGFAAGAIIPQDSILVGGLAARHPPIVVTPSGRLPSTTVLVASDMPSGFKDILINDGSVAAFASAYEVRRSIAISPARGSRAIGTRLAIEGWGFTDGALVDVRINNVGLNYKGGVTIANGHFVASATIMQQAGNGLNNVSVVDPSGLSSFPGTYWGLPLGHGGVIALSPVVYSGAPNQAFLVEGLADMVPGSVQPITINEGTTVRSAVTQWGINASGGTFPATWVKADSPVPAAADRMVVTDAKGNGKEIGLDVQRSICLCPVTGNGAAGWTVSVTGFGFAAGTTLAPGTPRSIAFGSATTWHATTTITDGSFGPLAATMSVPLFGGAASVNVGDATGIYYFYQHFRIWPSIGLTWIAGRGTAGETTGITGTGYPLGSTVNPNTITFSGITVAHAGFAEIRGQFGPIAITLPALMPGPKDVTAIYTFPQAYRVYNPAISVSKYRNPPSGVKGTEVTWSFSFTNTGYAGGAFVTGMVLLDTIPAGTAYSAGSTTSALPSTLNWYHSGCACWTASDLPSTDVVSVRWTLTSPLPAGASGYASFRATAQ